MGFRTWLFRPLVERLSAELAAREIRLQVITDELADLYRKARAIEMRLKGEATNGVRLEVNRDDGDLNALLRARKGL